MKYVLTGSLGNIGKPLATQLVKEGHDVTVITSSADRKAAIEALGAKAAVGSIEDINFLATVFTGADAVYLMVPPKWDAADWKSYIENIGKNYADAVIKSGVKRIVHLSSIGAHMATGAGPVSGIHRVENVLNALEGISVRHLRPAFFYTNLLANISMIKQMNIIGANYGEHHKVPMVHPNDIALVVAEELNNANLEGKSNRYILGDERSGDDIAKVLGTAIGKPELPWVNFTDEQQLQGFLSAGMSEEVSSNYVEMGHALASGEMASHMHKHRPGLSAIKLEDFAKEFAAVYGLG